MRQIFTFRTMLTIRPLDKGGYYCIIVKREDGLRWSNGYATRLICRIRGNTIFTFPVGLQHAGDGNFFIIINQGNFKSLATPLGTDVSVALWENPNKLGVDIPDSVNDILKKKKYKNLFDLATDGKKRNLLFSVSSIKRYDKQQSKTIQWFDAFEQKLKDDEKKKKAKEKLKEIKQREKKTSQNKKKSLVSAKTSVVKASVVSTSPSEKTAAKVPKKTPQNSKNQNTENANVTKTTKYSKVEQADDSSGEDFDLPLTTLNKVVGNNRRKRNKENSQNEVAGESEVEFPVAKCFKENNDCDDERETIRKSSRNR
eukprot:Awhi_evm1s15423